jgi:Ecdysteroid kinase-like family
LYPVYKKFQEEKAIDVKKEGFYQIPFCYKTLAEDPHEALYLDDLKPQGFEMFDRLQQITKEQVLIVMRTLAKLHAVFFCMKDQKPKSIQTFRETIDIFMLRKGEENMNVWFESVKVQAKATISNCGNADMIQKLDDLLQLNLFDFMELCVSPELAEPYAIICHGDVSRLSFIFSNISRKTTLKALKK